MVKRPMHFLLVAYLLGILSTFLPFWLVLLLVMVLLFLLYLVFFHFRIITPFINQQDKILFFVPILILLGYIRQTDSLVEPQLEDKFDQSLECRVEGTIDFVECGKNSIKIKLKDCKVIVEDYEISVTFKDTVTSKIYECDAILVYVKEQKDYKVGNRIQVTGELSKFEKPTNSGQFHEEKYYKMLGYDYKIYANQMLLIDGRVSYLHHTLQQVKEKFIRTYTSMLPEKEAGLLTAMLLGDKIGLEDDVKTLYQKNGIAHILAISGLHVTIIGMAIYRLFQFLGLGMKMSCALSIAMIVLYGILTGFSVSTNRSVVMLMLTLIAKVIGRTYDTQTALSMSALIILIQNPLNIQNVGFLLSFGAIAGMVYVGPALQLILPTKKKIMNTILISTAVQLATLPIILNSYYEIPSYSILINLIVIPSTSLLTINAMVGGVIGMLLPNLGEFLMGICYYLLIFYEIICKVFEKLPLSILSIGKPTLEVIFLYYFILILFLFLINITKHPAAGISLLFLLIIFYRSPNPGIRITFLDVGQGDSIYLESKSGTTYLVDGGSSSMKSVGQYRIQPFLKSQGVNSLDYVFVTHSDADHINGITQLMEEEDIQIRNLVLPDIEQKDEDYEYLEALAKKQGIITNYMKQEDVIVDGEITIRCLHPTSGYKARNTNESSLVLLVEYHEFQMLLTGDVEGRGESLVIDYLEDNDVDVDVLKVAHHGSKYSTPMELLELITPQFALISAGEENSYGHPHMELMERLEKTRSNIYSTIMSGAIQIETNGEWIHIKEFLKRTPKRN